MTTGSLAPDRARPPARDGDRMLRLVLRLDAAASAACGLLFLAGGPALDEPLGLPLGLLAPVGVFLLGWAAGLWYLASRPRISRAAVAVVIGLNLLWVADSVLTATAGWFSLTAAGVALVLAQAVAVAGFADLQYLALRRYQPAAR